MADPQTTACDWHEDGDGAWQTSCVNAFVLNDGTPWQNDMRFCCYCGKPLAQWVLSERVVTNAE